MCEIDGVEILCAVFQVYEGGLFCAEEGTAEYGRFDGVLLRARESDKLSDVHGEGAGELFMKQAASMLKCYTCIFWADASANSSRMDDL